MKAILPSFTFLLLVCATYVVHVPAVETGLDTQRVINGTIANKGQFPFIVLLRRINAGDFPSTHCTGSLITTTSVLSAAHCINLNEGRSVLLPQDLDGLLGTVDIDKTDNRITFKEFRVHKNYDPVTTANDVSMLVVNGVVVLKDFIKTIALPRKGLKFVGKDVISVGWGDYRFVGDTDTKVLRYMKAKVMDPVTCRLFNNDLNEENQVCTVQGEHVCVFVGDSGGPLVRRSAGIDVSIGIASFVLSDTECGGYPAVYTSTSAFHDWIQNNVDGVITFI